MSTATRVDIIVVSWNGVELLRRCLTALAAQTRPGRILVVDNASSEDTAAVAADFDVVWLPQAVNLGFAGGVNAGLARATAPYVALLNNDAEPEPRWLEALAAALDADPGLAAVTPKVLLEPGRLNSAGGWLDGHGHGRDLGFGQPDDGRADHPAEVFYAPGTACLLRRSALDEITTGRGGSLAAELFLYYEDVDLGWRLRLAGHRAGYVPAARVAHAHSASAVTDSRLHVFHDARNRLVVLIRVAPGRLALQAALRLPVTAAGFAGRGEWRRAGVLVTAWVSFLRLLPTALRGRRAVGASVRRSRSAVFQDGLALARAAGALAGESSRVEPGPER